MLFFRSRNFNSETFLKANMFFKPKTLISGCLFLAKIWLLVRYTTVLYRAISVLDHIACRDLAKTIFGKFIRKKAFKILHSFILQQKYDSTMNQAGWPANFYYDNGHHLQDTSSSTVGYEISNSTSREDYRGFSSNTSANYHLQGNFFYLLK